MHAVIPRQQQAADSCSVGAEMTIYGHRQAFRELPSLPCLYDQSVSVAGVCALLHSSGRLNKQTIAKMSYIASEYFFLFVILKNEY